MPELSDVATMLRRSSDAISRATPPFHGDGARPLQGGNIHKIIKMDIGVDLGRTVLSKILRILALAKSLTNEH